MRFLFYILIFLFCLPVLAQTGRDPFEVDAFGANPGKLKLFVHEPLHKPSGKMPLVVVLHGCSENAMDAANLSGWNKLADTNSFLVIYPQQSILNNPNLCFNWFNAEDITKGSGECESICQMIRYARKTWAIDSTKIFITGLSAGGAMTTVMMATHPELFQSGAVMAGGAYHIADGAMDALKAMKGEKEFSGDELANAVKAQNPGYSGRYPKMIIYQGQSDKIVRPATTRYLLQQWCGVQQCDTIADETIPSYAGIAAITRYVYKNSSGQAVITLYKLKGVGHRLAVKPGDAADEGGSKGLFGIDIGYHSTYHVAKEFGLILQGQ